MGSSGTGRRTNQLLVQRRHKGHAHTNVGRQILPWGHCLGITLTVHRKASKIPEADEAEDSVEQLWRKRGQEISSQEFGQKNSMKEERINEHVRSELR